MDVLKWIGSVLIAIVIVTVFLSVGAALALTGLVISGVLTAGIVVGAVALGIKKFFDSRQS